MLQWEMLKSEFADDTTLRDIYVLETTLNDWQLLFDELKTAYQLQYSVDGHAQQWPDSLAKIFAVRERAHPMVSFDMGQIIMVSHFFTYNEIEFDILAHEINSQQRFDALLGFLRSVGDHTGKPVLLTDENNQHQPIISYRPGQKTMCYHNNPT
jgi:hypothetical protein